MARNVLAWSPHVTTRGAAPAGAALAPSLDHLVGAADSVTLHMRLGQPSHHVIDERVLSLMQPSALLVNTARAALVDESVPITPLRAGRIAGAGLDVVHEEPLPERHVFRSLPNVLATPHLGYVTGGNCRSYFTEAVENMRAYLGGEPVRILTEQGC